MILYAVIAAAAVFLAVLAGMGNFTESPSGGVPHGRAVSSAAMFWLFVLLAVPAILRYNVGNDYMRYVAFMHLADVHAYVPTEWGFNTLVRLIYGICGYENYLLVFAVFAVLTIALFLLDIRLMAEDFAFSFFLFMCFGFYFRTYNTVRYYFALSLVLLSLHLLFSGYRISFILTVLAAALFHKSALVVLALYPLCMIRWTVPGALAGAGIVAVLSLLKDFWLRVVIRLYPSYRGTSFEAGGTRSMANILCCAAVLCLAAAAAFVERKKGEQPVHGSTAAKSAGRRRVYLQMNAAAFVLHLFCWFIPEISRIGYYLTITQIFLIPMLLKSFPGSADAEDSGAGRIGKVLLSPRGVMTSLAIAAALCYFALFLKTADNPAIRILPYQTFLFHDEIPSIIE